MYAVVSAAVGSLLEVYRVGGLLVADANCPLFGVRPGSGLLAVNRENFEIADRTSRGGVYVV